MPLESGAQCSAFFRRCVGCANTFHDFKFASDRVVVRAGESGPDMSMGSSGSTGAQWLYQYIEHAQRRCTAHGLFGDEPSQQ